LPVDSVGLLALLAFRDIGTMAPPVRQNRRVTFEPSTRLTMAPILLLGCESMRRT
jgi:hypothetical protein